MSSLDDILGPAREPKRGCQVCGEPTRATLIIQIRESAGPREARHSRGRSWSASLCEKHVIERLAQAREALS